MSQLTGRESEHPNATVRARGGELLAVRAHFHRQRLGLRFRHAVQIRVEFEPKVHRVSGKSYVVGDQYSITPLSSADSTTRFAALYRMTRTAALCVSTILMGSAPSDVVSYT